MSVAGQSQLLNTLMHGRGQITIATCDSFRLMLHEFLSSNREELIQRCQVKVTERGSPHATSLEPEYGVPLVLTQLAAALRHEETLPAVTRDENSGRDAAAFAENNRTNSLRGKEMLEQGFSVEQVVHGYGDVCQAITELAKDRNTLVTADEFHTLNRLLDHAIADAVSSYGEQLEITTAANAQSLHLQMGALAEEQRRLVEISLKALTAVKLGHLSIMGATGGKLEKSLVQLRDLIDRSMPELRLSTGMTRAKTGR